MVLRYFETDRIAGVPHRGKGFRLAAAGGLEGADLLRPYRINS